MIKRLFYREKPCGKHEVEEFEVEPQQGGFLFTTDYYFNGFRYDMLSSAEEKAVRFIAFYNQHSFQHAYDIYRDFTWKPEEEK